MNYIKPLKIGNVRLENNLFLAPMVDVTDLAFRTLCRKYGAGMAYTEMIYLDAILHENEGTKKLMKTSKSDRPIGLQITGNNIEEFERAGNLEELRNYDLIDLNCGCPSLKITGSSAGSFLLNHPDKIGKMIRILKDKGFVVTAKIRLGFKENNVLKVSREVEKAGADALTIHARLANQGSSVLPKLEDIKKVKNKIGIPVIGNGNIFSGKDAEEMFEKTGCDGVMIARGAIGNPFVFREILQYFKEGKEEKASKEERFYSLMKYLILAKRNDVVDMGRVKYLGASFLKGFPGSAKVRDKFMKMKSFEEISVYVDSLE